MADFAIVDYVYDYLLWLFVISIKMGIMKESWKFFKSRNKFLRNPMEVVRQKRNSMISNAKNSLKQTVNRSLTDFGRKGIMQKIASKVGRFALGLDGKGRRRSRRKRRVGGRGLRTFAAIGLRRRWPAIAHAPTASGLYIPHGRK